MRASTRLTSWLRFACALVLSVGLSSAAAASVTGSPSAPSAVPAVSHLAVAAATAHSVTVRGATAVRHAVAKHHSPAIGSALAVAGIMLAGLATYVVRRRRHDPALRHHALSHGARAPPAVSCC